MGARVRVTAIMFLALSVGALTAAASAAPREPFAGTGSGSPEGHGSYLGVNIAELTPQHATALKVPGGTGVLVVNVDQDGPACHAGLRDSDVIVGFNGNKVTGAEQLATLIHNTSPGKSVTLAVIRDGQPKNLQVKLGDRAAMMETMPPYTYNATTGAGPIPPPPHDMPIPSVNVMSSRSGLMVESLTSQLGDYFGVAQGQGVLIRSVAAGSPAAAAGLKAGDVIVQVNGQQIHDLSDWRMNMHSHGGKVNVRYMREKHAQSADIMLPQDSSKLGDDVMGWSDFDTFAFQGLTPETQQQIQEQARKMSRQAEEISSRWAKDSQEMARLYQPDEKQTQEMQRSIEQAMKVESRNLERLQKDMVKALPSQREMGRIARDAQKSVPDQKQIEQMSKQMQESLKPQLEQMQKQLAEQFKLNQKDIRKMTDDLRKSMPDQKQMEEMATQIRKSMPDPKQVEQMSKDMQESIQKNWAPQMEQLKQQMEEFHKQMEQNKLNWPKDGKDDEF